MTRETVSPPTSPPSLPRNGTWKTYTPADGLAGLQVDNIVADAEGWLWIGTLTGASRFDGDAFETFNSHRGLCGDQVYALCPDREGRMWVGLGDGGVCRYRDGQFDELAANKGPLHSGIRYLLEDRHGRMWCAGRGMLGYCEGDDYRDLMPQLRTLLDRKPGEQVPFLWSIVEDDEGVIWFRDIFDPDLLAFDGNRLHKVDLAGVSGGGFDLELHPSAGLWIGANQGGRKSGDAPLWRYEEQTCEPCGVLVEGAVRRIRVDSSGRTWLATTGGGVLYSEDDGFS